MVYSDNFAEGMGYLLIFIAGILFVTLVLELPVLYWILKRTTNQNHQLAILAVALLPGYVFFMNLGGPLLALAFIGPVATLIPPFIRPDSTGSGSRFKRIVLVFGAVTLFEIFLLFVYMQASAYLGTVINFEFNPAYKTAQYAVLVILDILFAFAVYRIMQRFYPGVQEQKESPA